MSASTQSAATRFPVKCELRDAVGRAVAYPNLAEVRKRLVIVATTARSARHQNSGT